MLKMNRPIYEFFEKDHRRIEAFFEKAIQNPAAIDFEMYHHFRTGLLKHIKMEEKILFPAAQKGNGGIPLPLAAKLRLDHGALTTLMVLPPNDEVVKVIRYVMEKHDEIEEAPGGMYEQCEKLTESETQHLLQELITATEVPVHPHNEAGYALKAAKRSLERAGFDFDGILKSNGEVEE